MAQPLATAIIPTWNRSSTLRTALASVQSQTQQNIEIIIVLDGATKACKEIAHEIASHDGRVRVFDFPKSPGGGEVNVHAAVLAAQSEYIFYNDDDDLWLPHHVETLAAVLQDADIADSRVATADRHFHIHLAPCPASNINMKELLTNYQHKNLFDTHIAHTKSAYRRFAQWVPETGISDRPVWAFFEGFAKDEACIWKSTPEVTALSLHGANRKGMTEKERAAEIEQWWGLACHEIDFDTTMTLATAGYHLFRLLQEAQICQTSFDQFCNDYGAHPDLLEGSVERSVFNLCRGTTLSKEQAIEACCAIARAAFVGFESPNLLPCLAKHFEESLVEEILLSAQDKLKNADEGILLALGFLYFQQGEYNKARGVISKAEKANIDPVGQIRALQQKLQNL